MKINLGWKLGLTYLILIVIAMVSLGSFIIEDYRTTYIGNTRDNLLRYANVIANKSVPFIRQGDEDNYLDYLARDYSQQMGNRILILDNRSLVLADSANELKGHAVKAREVAQALEGKSSYQLYQTDSYGLVLYLAVPIASGQQNLGAVFIAADMTSMSNQLASLQERLIVFGITMGLTIFGLSLLLARLITRPVEKLYKGVKALEKGNYGTQVEIATGGEFATLAKAFNEMSSKVAEQDQIRRQFVANASHELRSPLASIKALLDSSDQSNLSSNEIKELLGDINHEIDRLNKLVGDLLLLSKIEKNRSILKIQEVNLGELCYQVAKTLEPLAKQHQVSLNLVASQQIYWPMDGEMMFRALYNLIDNAIKYSPPNKQIDIGYASEKNLISMWVADKGPGIAEEELEKIFLRFYRLDKARSRETGGAGLGLSIVNEIVTLHNGEIKIKSQAGQGSVFTIILKN